MSDAPHVHHLTRLRTATTSKLGRSDLPDWIEKNTFINGKPFSFAGHEYQKQILLDKSPELVIRKSAQTGISEMSMRMALGLLMIMPGSFRVAYTFPSASFASGYSKTRLNPIITSSPTLMAAISSADLDSAEMKTFGPGKELYLKGSAVGNAALSTTIDMLYHDELSFSSPEVIGDYWSRVLHSQYKWRVSLSTPTYVSDPIDQAFTSSRQHWNFCRCEHCSHMFVPDYYENVYIPGWGSGKDLNLITKSNLHKVNHKQAEFRCPKCAKPTSLMPDHREWVCANPSENHIAAGYQVQPFDAPTVVTLSDLIIASTKYNTTSKFKQFSLGRPATDSESGLEDSDLEAIGVDLGQSPFTHHFMGIDIGVFSHFMVAGMTQDGVMLVVHYERVPLKDFQKRYWELKSQFRIGVTTADIQPFTDLVMSLSESDPRLYAARYVTRQGIEVYDLKQEDKDAFNAIEGVREVSLNRNALFDRLLASMRPEEGRPAKIQIRRLSDWDMLKTHVTGMRRAQAQLRNGEYSSVWQKPTDGADHFFHALGYAWISGQLRGVASGAVGGGMPGVHTFKHAPKKTPEEIRRDLNERYASMSSRRR